MSFGRLGSLGRGFGRMGGGGIAANDPLVRLSSNTIAEDAADNSVVGTLSVSNSPDGVTWTFAIDADPDNKFAIANDDELQIDELLDYETATSHLVTIEATPSAGDPITREFTITVTNVFEAATLNALTLDTDEIQEHSAEDTAIGTLQDVTSGSTLSLTDDAGGRFKLSGEDIVAGAVETDYQVATSHNITVRETLADSSNSPRDSVIAITVTELTIVAPTLDLVAGSDSGSSDSDDITADNTPDILITFGTSLVEGDIIRFQHDDNNTFTSPTEVEHEVDASDVLAGTVTLTTGTLPSPTAYLRAMHSRGAHDSDWSTTLTLTIDVTAPTITSSSTASVDENATLSHSLTADETVAWSITGGADSAEFEISGSTLRWASNGTQDYEDPQDANTDNDYVVQITATDTAGNATNQTITVTVDDVADSGYTAVAVNFDGSNDYLTRAGLAAGADGRKGIISFWYQINGGDGADQPVLVLSASGGSRFMCYRDNSNRWRLTMREQSVGTDLITGTPFATAASSIVAGAGWHHFIASWDLAVGVTSLQLYIDGSDARSGTPTVTTTTDIDYITNQAAIGANFAGSNKINMDLAELYFNIAENIDLSSSSNLQKWRTSGGKPENLGSDGSTPTGTQPVIYLKNPVDTWQDNLGTGGNFTENGALTTSSSSPSD